MWIVPASAETAHVFAIGSRRRECKSCAKQAPSWLLPTPVEIVNLGMGDATCLGNVAPSIRLSEKGSVMELTRLMDELSKVDAYPFPTEKLEIFQTHISVVFLAGEFAYKLKKPVKLGFLDYSTLEKRRHFCEEEIRLNRRLAPEVYLGLVPITKSERGLQMEGTGEAIEWAIKMKRLAADATLLARMQHDDVTPETIEAIARRVADFHMAADTSKRISSFGGFDMVARNFLEHFEQSRPQIGVTLTRDVFERLRTRVETSLVHLRTLIQDRADRGIPRDTHGDLRLGHVYLFPERQPPAEVAIVDCIEFNERFRFADPVSDMAFLAMGLAFHGRRDLADTFVDAYFRITGDDEGRELLPFYAAYRAAVRGKVEGFKVQQKEVPEAERNASLAKARAYWLFALGELEDPEQRPCLVMVGGLPGTGKSTLARNLASQAKFEVIRSDVVRKEIAGLTGEAKATNSYQEGIYSPEWTHRTYAECLRRTGELLFKGKRVVVDASFREENFRRHFIDAAVHWGVPVTWILCEADSEAVQTRLRSRRGDVSDADWSVYLNAAAAWEQPSQQTLEVTQVIFTGNSERGALQQALESLARIGLYRSH